jgi:hypothetical protein
VKIWVGTSCRWKKVRKGKWKEGGKRLKEGGHKWGKGKGEKMWRMGCIECTSSEGSTE